MGASRRIPAGVIGLRQRSPSAGSLVRSGAAPAERAPPLIRSFISRQSYQVIIDARLSLITAPGCQLTAPPRRLIKFTCYQLVAVSLTKGSRTPEELSGVLGVSVGATAAAEVTPSPEKTLGSTVFFHHSAVKSSRRGERTSTPAASVESAAGGSASAAITAAFFTTRESLPAAGSAKVVSLRASMATLGLHLGFKCFNYGLLRLTRFSVLALAG